MKFKELAQLSKEEREKKKLDLEMELIKLNTQVATGTPPKNAGSIKRIKKDLAKMKFIEAEEKNSESKQKPKSHLKPEDLPKAKADENKKNKKTE